MNKTFHYFSREKEKFYPTSFFFRELYFSPRPSARLSSDGREGEKVPN